MSTPGPDDGTPRRDDAPARADEVPVEAPARVRAALVRLAAEVLGGIDPREVPAPLLQVRRFTPRRRAAAGAAPLWATLGQDAAFRSRVARAWSTTHPELAAELLAPPRDGAQDDGGRDDDAQEDAAEVADTARADGAAQDVADAGWDVVELAVGAFLLRPEAWPVVMSAARREDTQTPSQTDAEPSHAATMRLARADAEVARLTALLAAARHEAEDLADEVGALRKEQRRLRADADRARSEARRARDEAAAVLAEAEQMTQTARVELDRAEEEQRRAAAVVGAARQDAAVLRDLAEVRVRLLLDTIVDAGASLRHELALPPAVAAPADLVAPQGTEAAARPTSRGRAADDPALLDELLALPHAHLVVDGYNVSKTGFGELSLIEQRTRLVDRLANLAARTGAEVTCCFDGQEGNRPPGGYQRSVRVLFSVGEIADDLIRRIVRAEPPGRVVVVVSSDQEVAADTAAAGARVVPAATLLARLSRV